MDRVTGSLDGRPRRRALVRDAAAEELPTRGRAATDALEQIFEQAAIDSLYVDRELVETP
jgi:hypothetical protein